MFVLVGVRCLESGFMLPAKLPAPCNQVKGTIGKLVNDLGDDKKIPSYFTFSS